ncbi:hypothetical protein J3R30DRAFT_3700491 [Lentinula aciculospora]|uniref:Uncharacterized protein n=1 Tax=Lentinula aciculospora TaxID=153920 RepID=A0A9W9AFS0_9AGAR|nr:hypothetical protein J3R30DRAFT_3700491 [Lentinula aciculospora]
MAMEGGEPGGWSIADCTPGSFTELKRAPRRHLAKRKLDDEEAYKAFYVDWGNQLNRAVNDLLDYTIIYSKKYPNASKLLAIAASGPFWRYAVIRSDDRPWTEPRTRNTRDSILTDGRRAFYNIFGQNYFEIGTVRSDNELDKIRQVYFMGEEGEIGHRSKVTSEGLKVSVSSEVGSSAQSSSTQRNTRSEKRSFSFCIFRVVINSMSESSPSANVDMEQAFMNKYEFAKH